MDWKKTIAGLYFLLLVSIIVSCSKEQKSKSQLANAGFADSTVVALVNGEPIHYSDVDKGIKEVMSQLEKDPSQFGNLKPDTTLRKEILDWLVSTRLLVQEAKKLNINGDFLQNKNFSMPLKRRTCQLINLKII